MSINTLDQWIASRKQRVTWMKTGARTTLAAFPFNLMELAGNPGAGNLTLSNTANGIVPVNGDAGYPLITSFAGNLGYISKVEFSNSVACTFDVYDRLFVAGSFTYAAQTNSLTAQPSYAGRILNSNYGGLQAWIEVTTPFLTGNNWTVHITYTDQDGNAGAIGPDLPVMAAAGLTLGRMYQLPLAAGDSGIQKIESVVVTNGTTAMTAGAFNVMVLNPLWFGRVPVANGGDVHDLLRTGMPQIFDTSALYCLLTTDAAASGFPDLSIQVAMG
jgi:hypothetical protein